MRRRTAANISALSAGWMAVLYLAQLPQGYIGMDRNLHPIPFSPFIFLIGAMSGITLVYVENVILERWESRRTRMEA